MGLSQSEYKPSFALPGKGHFILSSGDRGTRNRGQMGKGEEVPMPSLYLLDKKRIPAYLSSQVGERVKRVRGYKQHKEV